MRQTERQPSNPAASGLLAAALAGFVLLAGQIVLGGWVSTNYAALACTDLPTRQGRWLPEMEFGHAVHMLRELGQTADGALLSLPALSAIHWTHRLGAVIVAVNLIALGVLTMRAGLRREGQVLHALITLQFLLDLSNVCFGLPLVVAVAHNAGAALLVMLLVVINFRVAKPRSAVTLASHQKTLTESPR